MNQRPPRPHVRLVLLPVLAFLLGAALLGTALLTGPAEGRQAASTAPSPTTGWFLTVVEHGAPGEYGLDVHRQRLELVSPTGERSTVYAKRLGPHQRGYFSLVDWSTDGSTALLLVDPGARNQRAVVVHVPGGSRHRIPLGDSVSSILLGGHGTLLAEGYAHDSRSGAPLWRIAPDGRRTRLDTRVEGPLLASPDDSTVVTGARGSRGHVLRVLDRRGRVTRRIDTATHCTPTRWWDDHTVLAQCLRRSSMTLSLVDLSTGKETRLTRPHGRHSEDLGDIDARRIASGLYLQATGPCGYVFLARQHADGSVTKVRVPHAVGNVLLVGARGHRLVIEHATSCDGARPRAVLSRFDPVSKDEHLLVGLTRRADFGAVLPFGERRASSY